MITITNLNQTSPAELRKIIEDNGIIIKGITTRNYKVNCPNCDKPEAYIYFNQGTRTIDCNREDNCNFKENLWDYIANKRGFSTKDMTRYINQMLGYEFKDLNGGVTSYTPIDNKTKLITTPPVTKPLKTIEEIEEERGFFNCCHQIFINCLNDQGNEQVAFSLEYLKKERGYNDEQIRNFKLGFFPDKDKFISLLTNAGYSKNKAEDLTTKYFTAILKINNYQKEEESKNRIAFTWFDPDGNIIGFSVRKPTTNNELKPKYLNNNGLSKTEYLFNFTKDIADKELVIVEGQLDALVGTYFAWQQEETSNYHFVAIGGSSISESQVNYLKKYSYSKVILLPDNDKNAGEKGAKESIEKLLAQSITPYIASIPYCYPCKDIDELIKTYEDEIDIKAILKNAVKQEMLNTNNSTPKEEPKMTMQNNSTQKSNPILHPKVQELLNNIKEDQKLSIDNKEILDIHKYRTQCYEIEKLILENNINAERINRESDLKTLANILSNINRYNGLLTTDYDNDQPLTWGKYTQILNNNQIGLKTGFPSLDKYVTIQPSSLVFVAGRPSHGKTTMMLNMLKNMVKTYPDKSFLFYSYEEEEKTILSKIILTNTELEKIKILERKYPSKSYLEILELEIGNYEGKVEMNEGIYQAKKEIEEWITNQRLQILDKKPSVESLTSAIIERCMTCSNSKKDQSKKDIKPIAAVFIDYVQKLSTEEERVNRQQEIQRICSILLNTSQDKRVRAAFILGTQANRETKSSDTFNLHNMKDAGDIEQDANLVLGVWNPLAAKMQMLQNAIDQAEMQLQLIDTFEKNTDYDLTILLPENKRNIDSSKKQEMSRAIKIAKTKLQNLANNEDQTLIIKILKNRNGKKDLDISLNTRLSQFLIIDPENSKQK